MYIYGAYLGNGDLFLLLLFWLLKQRPDDIIVIARNICIHIYIKDDNYNI